MYIPLYLFSMHLIYNHCIQLLNHCYLCWYHCCLYFFFFFFFLFDHGLIGISFHSIEQYSCRQLYTGILYVSWHVSAIFTHNYTYILVHIHFWYTYYICTIYLLNTCMTCLSTIFVCLYLYILHSNGGVDWHMYIPLYIYIYIYCTFTI